MSGAGPLIDSEKTDARRYCGYPAYGSNADSNEGYRFFQQNGNLEYRLNNLSPSELIVCRNYLGSMNQLEAAIPAAGANLDTAKAAVWTHNPNEVSDRSKLFDQWARRLCAFLGVPAGPGLGSGNSVDLIV